MTNNDQNSSAAPPSGQAGQDNGNPLRIALLGSTGSIGTNTFPVVEGLSERFRIVAATAHNRWQELAEQARRYELEEVIVTNPSYYNDLKESLSTASTRVHSGNDAMVELVQREDIDIVIVAVVGIAALPAVLAATRAGKRVAVANKEALVVAGCLLMPLARQSGATILPIDSEHSAILQAMHSGAQHEVRQVIITCSGGPFRNASPEQLKQMSWQDALKHPTWNMGPKITIDSATQMNKALEIIEARWLFDLSADAIDVLIHPESIVHSLVEFCDGSVIAQLSEPNMRLPIQYALTFPDRHCCPTPRLDLSRLARLHFERPAPDRFPAIRLGFEAARRGGTAGAVLNAANEAAIPAFERGLIRFTDIAALAEHCLDRHGWIAEPSMEQLLEADRWAREETAQRIEADATLKEQPSR